MDVFWKDKKIVAYIALKHHIRFIVPIMEQLAASGADIRYLVGNADRSQEITAIEAKLEYCHAFDYISDSDNNDVCDTYQMLKNGFADSLLKDTAFGVIMPTLMDRILFSTAQEYIGFKNYLATQQPDVCLALHEVNRWGKMFAFQAKKLNIPCITLQEGLLTTATEEKNYNFIGHVQYSALALLWGNATKEKLAAYEAPEDRLILAGNTHLAQEISRIKTHNIRAEKRKRYHSNGLVSLLIFSIYLPPLTELMPLFQSFVNTKKNQLFIKFHPGTIKTEIDKWLRPLNKKIKESLFLIHGEESTYDLMAISDICILTEGSTTGLEALAMDKPVVELSLDTKGYHASLLSEQNAAISMSPKHLAEHIHQQTHFMDLMNPEGIKTYIQKELHEPEKSIQNAIEIMADSIIAAESKNPGPLISDIAPDLEWTIVLPVIDDPVLFLEILEAISTHSENESFEVVLIMPESLSPDISAITNSLEGDILFLQNKNNQTLWETINQAAVAARGQTLIFMEKTLAPTQGWLTALKEGMTNFNKNTIFGARIINKFNNIVHAGMVVNANGSPVSSYLYVDKKFPPAQTQRPFMMVNHFLCLNKNTFLKIGGFEAKAGVYAFLDYCLKSTKISNHQETVQYLPRLELIQVAPKTSAISKDDSIFFYSKWHGSLWENEDRLYQKDGVSKLQLEAARMTRVQVATETKSSLS
ncbi:MAG: hypothetical protein GY699_09805 [Desulfobacteraceae bacterium]|nr:hypothetical protein [Desulfobacteraceae bacterium]